MVTNYSIETRIINQKIVSEMKINEKLATSEDLRKAYNQSLYEEITRAHSKAIIKFGHLEKITTTFEI